METEADLYTPSPLPDLYIPSPLRLLNAAVSEDYLLATIIEATPPAANGALESAMAAQHTTTWWLMVGAVVLDTARLAEARAAVMG